MSKTKKEQTITINDKEYKESDLSQEQRWVDQLRKKYRKQKTQVIR